MLSGVRVSVNVYRVNVYVKHVPYVELRIALTSAASFVAPQAGRISFCP